MYKIIITLLFLFSATAYGAEVDNALLQKNLDAANLQIEILKAQVEVMKSYQDKFLSTVYWSLGGVLGIVVLLIGYNWFTNFKNQEKEVQTLKSYVEQELSSKKTDLEAGVKPQIQSILTTENNKLWKEIHDLRYYQILAEFNDRKQRGIYATCIRNINEMMTVSKNLSYQFRIHRILDSLIEILEIIHKEKKKYILSSDIVSIIQDTLNMVGDEYGAIKNKVNDLINQCMSSNN
ncbi:hypothetical protein FPL18_17035 [Acinetobacter gyllenbergii]|nr:hypothetical protein FPL18_17035 [Acinetobacter gyllenbergii]